MRSIPRREGIGPSRRPVVVLAAISARSRDFPIPGGPRIRHKPPLRATSSLPSQDSIRRNSSSRPISAIADPLATSSERVVLMSRSRQAGTRPPFPLSSSGGTATHTPSSPMSSRVVAPMRTSPGAAACSSRAAVFTGSPVTSARPPLGSPDDADAGVHADADDQAHPPYLLELDVQRVDAGDEVERSSACAVGIVLVGDGDAEDAHDGVADELLDRPPVAVQSLLAGCVVAKLDAPERLGIQSLTEGRRAHEVAEEQADELPELGRLGGGLEARPALRTELGRCRGRRSTCAADATTELLVHVDQSSSSSGGGYPASFGDLPTRGPDHHFPPIA